MNSRRRESADPELQPGRSALRHADAVSATTDGMMALDLAKIGALWAEQEEASSG
jgi:hypothetical protein